MGLATRVHRVMTYMPNGLSNPLTWPVTAHMASLWFGSTHYCWLSWTDISFWAFISSTPFTSSSQLQTMPSWGSVQGSGFLSHPLKFMWETAWLLHSSWQWNQQHVNDGKVCDSLEQTCPPQTTVATPSEFLESWTQGHTFLDAPVIQRSSESSSQIDVFQRS